MQWIRVRSSAVSALGYDPAHRTLGIEFAPTHQVYLYFEVPEFEFDAFVDSPSKGKYLTQVFIPKNYRCSGPHAQRRRAA